MMNPLRGAPRSPNSSIEPSSDQLVTRWLRQFINSLERRDKQAVAAMFAPEGFWRDCVVASWNICTAEGQEAIADMAASTWFTHTPQKIRLDEPATVQYGLSRGHFRFETDVFCGVGIVCLRHELCVSLFTAANSFKPSITSEINPTQTLNNGPDNAQSAYTLIVGGGHAGISLAAHLKALGVPATIVDKDDRPGDSWRRRYPSLRLQDPTHINHLPFRPFPPHWPQYMPKDALADWLKDYVDDLNLDFQASSNVKSAYFDTQEAVWHVAIEQHRQLKRWRCRQLVLATGLHGFPYIPDIQGCNNYLGSVSHSSQFKGGQHFIG